MLACAQDGHAKIEHFDVTVAANHHVLWLDVAMNDALRMSRTEGSRDLQRDVDRIAQRQAACAQPRAERLALDKLHRDERRGFRLADLEDGDDVGMIESG